MNAMSEVTKTRRCWPTRFTIIATASLLAACTTGTVVGTTLAKLIRVGKQTATIHIDFVSPGHPHPSFTGIIAGQGVTGKWSGRNLAVAHQLCPHTPLPDTDFTYTGYYDGTPYSFSGCVRGPKLNPNSLGNGRPPKGYTLVMRGNLGSEAISGSCQAFASFVRHSNIERISFPFHGKVGSQSLTGTAYLEFVIPGGTGSSGNTGATGTPADITANLTVS